ncbi:hemin importer ATP-binding subunit [Pandoraea morbifera]|uniref:Hemin importer ATP-binding subunit n=1 Tax=Pandoraea morbifera TaxID=2508300 RepID=A0A5E4TW01_9BURK|nr:ATP-binding cassette domain-containing protein [Pandoraea morbifera]VVD91412.1 hemin importer ATP-binding subunit [Pandoraea morbifera]
MLSAHDLTIAHTDSPVLDGLSLDIRPGELLVLLGRNGAGKSTLLKALAGEPLPPRSRVSGAVTVNGSLLSQFSAAALARLRAVLPQTAQLSFPFSALEIVAMGRLPFPRSRARAGQPVKSDVEIATLALERVGALPLLERDVMTLSGGEWARVQFARVLAQLWPDDAVAPSVPRYLLLDEPTAALDLAHQHHLLALTRSLAKSWGFGAMAIVHDINLAARHADRMALLADGRILATGAPRDVMRADLIEMTLGLPVQVITPAMLPGLSGMGSGIPFALPA